MYEENRAKRPSKRSESLECVIGYRPLPKERIRQTNPSFTSVKLMMK
jgi:hypothetical protein